MFPERPSSPSEWLETFKARGWQWVIADSQNEPVAAAYKFAYIVNAAAGYIAPTPTVAEVMGAYKRMCWCEGFTVIERGSLIEDCRALGLDVID